MKYRRLGKTDIEVSVVAMGCWAIAGGAWGPQNEADTIKAINACFDVGINFFDTAEAYGTEDVVGKALEGRRHEVIIATKAGGGHQEPDKLIEACENSMKRLRTDYIDLYQLHWPNWNVPFEETIGALKKLQEQGKIRTFGVSNFGHKDLSNFYAHERCETNQVAYNLLFRAIEYEIKPLCIDNETGILCYSPIAQGLLTGKFATLDDIPDFRARTRLFSGKRTQAEHNEEGCEEQVFKAIARIKEISERIGKPMGLVVQAWLIKQEGVTAVLTGARNKEQIHENAAAGDLEIPDDIIDELSRATEEVKTILGQNPDLWQSAGERIR